MSKQEKELVPELRFPEFHSERNWEFEKLGTIFAERQTKGFDHLPLLSLTDKDGIIPQEETNRKNNSSSDKSKYLKVCPGDVAYNTMRMWEGRSAYVNIEGLVSPAYTVCKPINKTNGLFFSYYFKTQQLIREFHRYSQGLVKDTLNLKYEAFSKIEAPVPLPDEQQKIADCLTSLDELISAQTQKLDTLKTHKKGLMQQLFPAEGEAVPKLRFPEFRDKGEWKLQKLEGLAKRGSGHTPNKQVSNYYNGGIKWVSLADSNKLDNGYIYATKIQISKEGIENSSAVLHPAGAVILSRDAGVGKSAVLHSEMAVSQHFIAWDCDETKLSNWFLYYVLQILKPAFESVAVGNTIKTIGLPYFKELCISVPSISEQKKIADCLTSLDERITAQAQKLDALKTHKKGLMQQLFPSVGGVAGEA